MELVRFGVYWANLDPTIGREMKKTRPVVVVSPDVMNNNLGTVLVCPLTSSQKNYPTRVKVQIDGRIGRVAIDHLRSIDKTRLIDQLDVLNKKESDDLVNRLLEVFKK